MEEIPIIDLVNSLRTQMEFLQRRTHELETENAKLSARLSGCICQKIVESDKTCDLDYGQLNDEMEMQKLDENHVKNKSKEKVIGFMVLLPRRRWTQP